MPKTTTVEVEVKGPATIDTQSSLSQYKAEKKGQNALKPFVQTVTSRSEQFLETVKERGRALTHVPTRPNRNFWIALGFGLGLASAGIITFRLIRRRMQRIEEENEQPIQLTYSATEMAYATIPTKAGETISAGQATQIEHAFTSVEGTASFDTSGTPAVEIVDLTGVSRVPIDASFIGVLDTKRYYPVETLRDQIQMPDNDSVELVYFVSEQEAQNHGYVAGHA